MNAAAPASAIILTEDLGKTYPNGTRALTGATLNVGPGEFVVIIGSSGAGKSTLLRCLNRLIRPTTGRYLLDGVDVTAVSGAGLRRVRQHVGMIFQQFNVVGRLTVLQNVLAGRLRFSQPRWASNRDRPAWQRPLAYGGLCGRYLLSLLRLAGGSDRAAAFDHLRQVGIAELAFQRADTLSGGQQQRVAIARALAQQPEVILADEPIASLDPRSAQQVMSALRAIRDTRGIPVIVNLHQVDIACQYATRIIGMNAGRVVFDGPPNELTETVVRHIYGDKLAEATADTAARVPALAPDPANSPIPVSSEVNA